jgi:hypothetical protein
MMMASKVLFGALMTPGDVHRIAPTPHFKPLMCPTSTGSGTKSSKGKAVRDHLSEHVTMIGDVPRRFPQASPFGP